MSDPLQELTEAIAAGLSAPNANLREKIEALFGRRYQKRHYEKSSVRDAYGLASEDGGIPFAGLINPDNPPSGPYGGTSVVWFPTPEGLLINFVVGTRGLAPDEGILTRPGHRRRIAALRRYLAKRGVECWTKPDPSSLGVSVPKTARDRFPGFEKIFQRYGAELYACARVPTDVAKARTVVQAFLDLYAYERGWSIMKAFEQEYDGFHAALRSDLFTSPSPADIAALLRQRRFVVLQGPPGTGKTRMAEMIRREHFAGKGITVQFHPGVTYEDFVVGLSPDAEDRSLHFDIRSGFLPVAARAAKEAPFLLIIDEINRADLGKVLGEAIYLFEPGEIGGKDGRRIQLPHAIDKDSEFSLPDNLFVLATMNTADRSIASMDLAIRRRFAFVTVPPDRTAIASQGLEIATRAFDMLSDVFVEHAPGEAMHLLPGHAYFLAKTDAEFGERVRYEIIPLIDEYLQQGLLGPASAELFAVRDALEDMVASDGLAS